MRARESEEDMRKKCVLDTDRYKVKKKLRHGSFRRKIYTFAEKLGVVFVEYVLVQK